METVTDTLVRRERCVEWSMVFRALPGERVCGDQHVVAASRDGVLAAVIDGLGHGDEATFAAQAAVAVLAAHSSDDVVALVQQCHRALRPTRGAAMTVLSVNDRDGTVTALGIGNVETVIVRAAGSRPARESILLRGGVVGYQLPTLQTSVFPLAVGDVMVFATDGVREDFGDRLNPAEPLPQLVNNILARKFRGTDDALVLACKYLGPRED
jgi:phosphoserine phosphatase RsbX